MGRWEQIILNLRAIPRLIKSPAKTIFYVQKVNYHCLAPKLVAKLRRFPLVVDFDDLEYQLHRPGCWQNRLVRHILRSAHACVTGSHYLLGWLDQFNPNVHLVYTGVDTDFFAPPPDETQRASELKTPTLVWSGGVFDETTLDAARGVLDFFGELNRINPETRLLLLAYGNRLSQLAGMIREHGAKGCIELIENVNPRDIPRWLRRAHFGIFYFPTITPWVKAKSPTKLFEYMACGVVPVCGRGTEADHVVTDGWNGILFDRVQDGADRIAKLLESSENWMAMSGRARQAVISKYALSEQVGHLSRLFQELTRQSAMGGPRRVSRRS